MMISIKNFIHSLILVLMIIFVTVSVTGCASAIKSINQADKARKAFKGAMAISDVVDIKRNASDLLDKILKHK